MQNYHTKLLQINHGHKGIEMLKAVIQTHSGKKLIILGLEKMNIVNIKEGRPIFINDKRICEHEICIMYGEDHEDFKNIMSQLTGKGIV